MVQFNCNMCGRLAQWRVDRFGDAVVGWACDDCLGDMCYCMQRSHEITELSVRSASRLGVIYDAFDKIAEG